MSVGVLILYILKAHKHLCQRYPCWSTVAVYATVDEEQRFVIIRFRSLEFGCLGRTRFMPTQVLLYKCENMISLE